MTGSSVPIGWGLGLFPSCIGCCRLGHVPKPRRVLLAIFPIFWSESRSVLVSRCHSALSAHQFTLTGDQLISRSSLPWLFHSRWHTHRHEHFQVNRRSLSSSSHHHPAAKNMEIQVLCRWVAPRPLPSISERPAACTKWAVALHSLTLYRECVSTALLNFAQRLESLATFSYRELARLGYQGCHLSFFWVKSSLNTLQRVTWNAIKPAAGLIDLSKLLAAAVFPGSFSLGRV